MMQAHIFYSGMVQGIGFRYTVERIVRQIGSLAGWVRNLEDGRVEIVVEGRKEDLDQLIAAVDQHFSSYIRNKEVAYEPTEGAFKDFRITY